MRRALGVPVHARRVVREQFDELIAATYNSPGVGAAALADDLAQDLDLSQLLQEIPKIEDLLDSQDDAPIIRLINALLTQALREGASDIHIEPFETRSVVRLRIDGTLRDLIEPARALHAAIVSRVKIMAQLDIAEKRLPQDGRITLRVAGRPVDVRVSTIPTGHGERVVLRLLDKQAGRLDLTQSRHGRRHARADGPADPRSRTASCWSPARPVRARPPRSTPRCRAWTPPHSTS